MCRERGVAVRLLAGIAVVTLCACWDQEAKLSPDQVGQIERNLLTEPPEMDHVVNADMGGEVTYLGMDANPVPVRPGEPLTLIHYWKVDDILFDWEVFVHLKPHGMARFNADHVPMQGLYPSSMWKNGQIIRDEQTIDMPEGIEKNIQVLVGLYRGNSRLKVAIGPSLSDGRIVAAVLPVEP
jgi:hypothetical protein